MKKLVLFTMVVLTALASKAIDVTKVRTAGPYKLQTPLMIDSVDAAQNAYSTKIQLNMDLWKTGRIGDIPKRTDENQAYVSGFSFVTKSYVNAEIRVEGLNRYSVYINGKELHGRVPLQPGQYDAVIKYVADTAEVKIYLDADNADAVSLVELNGDRQGKRPFTLADNMLMKHYNGVNVSPSGKYAIVSSGGFDTNGGTQTKSVVIDVATGHVVMSANGMMWMPRSDKLLTIRNENGKDVLICIDPIDLKETVLTPELPTHSFMMSPTEDFLILQEPVYGPKKEDGVFEILSPDDRQPGWRNRRNIAKMDLKTGVVQQLVFGYHNMWVSDISDDGKYLLFTVQTERLTARPTTLNTVYRMNLQTLESEVLIDKDGFVNSAAFIPGTNKLAVTGSAEAFGGVGKNLPDDMIPNSYDIQLFVFDILTKKVEAVTSDFNPSINTVIPSKADNMLYFTAQNADSVSLYRLDLRNGRIQMIEQPCEVITSFGLSSSGNTLLYYGTGACTSDRLYSLNIRSLKVTMLEELNADMMSEIKIGECKPLSFKSKNGYQLTGHYYLPADFDPSKKYPVIVHYYGGCSPTARRFGNGTHYPAHYWNALGYVVLIVNPRGASGFGQEWAAFHVNTAGEGIAEDIIEATQYLIDHNSWVNADKIGCVSASYGGFMTQLLLTKTDLFATGISHAGISDHTSYWGEGYWGYSYSETSMANSYPWTRKDLFVERSPLYNADKIHKPLLFTHGTADTNVPIGESIQMYTALKLLGVPTAFVMVEGENHGIMDYTKRQKWINTMVAWFQKYLQDDDSWWNAMYSPKDL